MNEIEKCSKCGRSQDKSGCRGGAECLAHQITQICDISELHAGRTQTLDRIRALTSKMESSNIYWLNSAIRALGSLYEAHRTAEKNAEDLVRIAIEAMGESLTLMQQREHLIDVVNERAVVPLPAAGIQVTNVAEGERTTYSMTDFLEG